MAQQHASHVSRKKLDAGLTHAVSCRYDSARSFRPPGRLMFLRPVKSAPQCAQSQRKYDAVWLQQEV